MKIEDFPLAWRWTNPKYAVFPENVLQELLPLSADSAGQLSALALHALQHQKLEFEPSEDAAATQRWFESLAVPSGRVSVVWDKHTALSVPWSLFCAYWNDFCYPFSDDVDIFLSDNRLLLRWRHDGLFEYDPGAL